MDGEGSECLDAYRDISGRATQEAKAEHVLEIKSACLSILRSNHSIDSDNSMNNAFMDKWCGGMKIKH